MQPLKSLNEICSQPDSLRNDVWEAQLFESCRTSKLMIVDPQPRMGPDHWPYIFAQTGMGSTEPALKVIEWLATQGVGLVLNTHKPAPDYIFSYGMIWNFVQNGEFLTRSESEFSGKIEIEAGAKVQAGSPSEAYLPNYVRRILRSFFTDQEVSNPKVLVMSQDLINYDLCLSLESLGDPPESEHDGIARALSWFLPTHYSLLLISEKGLPPFYSL
ncbi:MAG: hypothetical protein KDD22_00420 [Bdellovibrionales bacterium]|nr:hypothetical protein [Bdellovibrionales bacterium]